MSVDPVLLTVIGDVFLNLSAGWFGAAIILPGTHPRSKNQNIFLVSANFLFGSAALAIGYKFRILGI